MYKLCDLIGKKVICPDNATEVGTLVNALLNCDFTKIKYFELFNDDLDETLYVDTRYHTAVSDAVMLKQKSATLKKEGLSASLYPCPINLPVYQSDGKFWGVVSDVLFNGQEVNAICVGSRSFAPERIVKKSNEMIIIKCPDEEKEDKKSKTNGNVPVRFENNPSHIQAKSYPDIIGENNTLPTPKPSIPLQIPTADTYAKLNGFSFLLGKKVTRSLFDKQENALAYEGQTVDENLLLLMKRHNLLVTLALNAK